MATHFKVKWIIKTIHNALKIDVFIFYREVHLVHKGFLNYCENTKLAWGD